ncbi:hypothetical protein FQN53_007950 [Emmonsiellopsis sp. PD_33]|nr:hypothetical protein FQN53_007950 [Emmonsiellopsis sp. PD_33]
MANLSVTRQTTPYAQYWITQNPDNLIFEKTIWYKNMKARKDISEEKKKEEIEEEKKAWKKGNKYWHLVGIKLFRNKIPN